MAIQKEKSAKEINAEIKLKRNPAAPVVEDQDAPISAKNTDDARTGESLSEAEGSASADNDGASDSAEEAQG